MLLKSKIKKIEFWQISSFVLGLCLSFLVAGVALALETGVEYGTLLGLGTADIRVTIAKVIRVALGFLGIVGLGLVLYGGFVWMTSAGSADKVDKARKILVNGVIGLAIVLSAFAITHYILGRLMEATGVESCQTAGAVEYSTDNYTCVWQRECVLPFWTNWRKEDPTCGPTGTGTLVDFSVVWVEPAEDTTDIYLCSLVQAQFNRQLNLDTVASGLTASNPFTVDSSVAAADVNFRLTLEGTSLGNAGASCSSASECYSAVCNSNACEGDLVPGEIRGAGQTLQYIPSTDYLINTTYQAVIESSFGTGLKDTTGNTLSAGDKKWTFSTGSDMDTMPPRVRVVSPADSEVEVCLAAPVQAIFSEPMDALSLLDNITSEKNDEDVAALEIAPTLNFTHSLPDSSSLTAQPVGYYDTSTNYLPDLKAEIIRDNCGNYLDGNNNGVAESSPDDDYSWQFTSGNDQECLPEILSITPAEGSYYDDSTLVTITGRYLGLSGNVIFNDSVYAVNNCLNSNSYYPDQVCLESWSSLGTEIKLKVPADGGSSQGAVSGDVQVVVGVASDPYVYNILSPHLESIYPTSGGSGQFITLSGKNFGATEGTVYFKKTDGSENMASLPCGTAGWEDNSIVIEVPSGLSTGYWDIQVETATNHRSNLNYNFYFESRAAQTPGLCSISPDSGYMGDYLTLNGLRLSGSTQEVVFGDDSSNVTAYSESWTEEIPYDSVRAQVPNIAAQEGVWVRVLIDNVYSNYLPFNVLSVSLENPPVLEAINPDEGTIGQYVTLSGYGFGAEIGEVWFSNRANDWNIKANPPACSDYWKDTEIIVKVPDVSSEFGYDLTNNWNWNVWAKRQSDGLESAPLGFIINNDPLTPGLCELDPDNGPEDTLVQISGENFGAADGTITFYDDIAASIWNSWSDTKVTDVNIPVGAQTGSVYLWQANNYSNPEYRSNSLNFTVQDCRADADVCADEEECCNTGSCQIAGSCAAVLECSYNDWTFTTGETIVAGVADPECTNGSYQSPTPLPDDKSVCVNARPSIRFASDMDANTFTAANIKITKCNISDEDFEASECSSEVDGVFSSYIIDDGIVIEEGFVFAPTENLAVNYWYQVAVTDGVKDAEGNSVSPYNWHFKTGDDETLCEFDFVEVAPFEAALIYKNATQAYHAEALNNNCYLLGGYSWFWDSTDQVVATLSGSTTENETATAIDEGTTQIWANASAGANIVGSDYGRLTVNLSNPYVIDRWPNCQNACINASLGAQFNLKMKDSTFTSDNVLLYSCDDSDCNLPSANQQTISAVIYNLLNYSINFTGDLTQNTYYRVILTPDITSYVGEKLAGLNYNAAWGEECDPEAEPWRTNGGCSSSCTNEVLSNSESVCGNSTLEFGEECDDGNNFNNDGCSNNCLNEGSGFSLACGNNILDTGEECELNTPGCGTDCLWPGSSNFTTCGDGEVDQNFGEECDDGNQTDGDGCSKRCLNESSEPCSDPAESNCCGNNNIETITTPGIGFIEECEPGLKQDLGKNWADEGGCDLQTCLLTGRRPVTTCGNNKVEYGEECDDSNQINNDGCSSKCLWEGSTGLAVCGNSKVEDNSNDVYSWVFTTKAELCALDQVEVSPLKATINISDTQDYWAYAYSSPDNCSASGQRLDPSKYSWSWSSTQTSIATIVTAAYDWSGIATGLTEGKTTIEAGAIVDNTTTTCSDSECGQLTVSGGGEVQDYFYLKDYGPTGSNVCLTSLAFGEFSLPYGTQTINSNNVIIQEGRCGGGGGESCRDDSDCALFTCDLVEVIGSFNTSDSTKFTFTPDVGSWSSLAKHEVTVTQNVTNADGSLRLDQAKTWKFTTSDLECPVDKVSLSCAPQVLAPTGETSTCEAEAYYYDDDDYPQLLEADFTWSSSDTAEDYTIYSVADDTKSAVVTTKAVDLGSSETVVITAQETTSLKNTSNNLTITECPALSPLNFTEHSLFLTHFDATTQAQTSYGEISPTNEENISYETSRESLDKAAYLAGNRRFAEVMDKTKVRTYQEVNGTTIYFYPLEALGYAPSGGQMAWKGELNSDNCAFHPVIKEIKNDGTEISFLNKCLEYFSEISDPAADDTLVGTTNQFVDYWYHIDYYGEIYSGKYCVGGERDGLYCDTLIEGTSYPCSEGGVCVDHPDDLGLYFTTSDGTLDSTFLMTYSSEEVLYSNLNYPLSDGNPNPDEAVYNFNPTSGTVETWFSPKWDTGVGPGEWGALVYGINEYNSWQIYQPESSRQFFNFRVWGGGDYLYFYYYTRMPDPVAQSLVTYNTPDFSDCITYSDYCTLAELDHMVWSGDSVKKETAYNIIKQFQTYIAVSIDWQAGDWHHLAFSWDAGGMTGDGDDHLAIYVDGRYEEGLTIDHPERFWPEYYKVSEPYGFFYPDTGWWNWIDTNSDYDGDKYEFYPGLYASALMDEYHLSDITRDKYEIFTHGCQASLSNAPSVTSYQPTGEDNCRNSLIRADFSEAIASSGITSRDTEDYYDNIILVECTSQTNCEELIPENNKIHQLNYHQVSDEYYFTVDALADSPAVLKPNQWYKLYIRGGEEGVRNLDGVGLIDITTGTGDFYWTFKTKDIVCDVDYVEITIDRGASGTEINDYDLFSCAERNDCLDDADFATVGNQHIYRAQAKDLDGTDLTGISYFWREEDPYTVVDLIGSTGSICFNDSDEAALACDGSNCDEGACYARYAIQDLSLTSRASEGQAKIYVEAIDADPIDGLELGNVSRKMETQVYLCENPWPTLPYFPFEDTEGSDEDLEYPDLSSPWTNFEMYYCAGESGLNFVNNGSFEQDYFITQDEAVYYNGYLYQPNIFFASNNGYLERSLNQVYDSSYAGKVTAVSDKSHAVQAVNVIPNTDYVLSGRVYLPSGSSAAGVLEVWSDDLSNGWQNIVSVATTTINNWQDLELQFNSDDHSQVLVGLGVSGQAGDYVYVDALQLEKGFTATNYQDSGLLPLLKPAEIHSSGVIKEFLFTNPANDDGIGLKILDNPEHYSPDRWYNEQNFLQGAPQSFGPVDGYAAVRDGRTVYVAAANLDYNSPELYTNIYVFSYSEDASVETQEIFEQILGNWRFNINIFQTQTCNLQAEAYYCSKDADCPEFLTNNETCEADKDKIIRDVTRYAEIVELRENLDSFYNAYGYYPLWDISQSTFSGGTYLAGLTFSTWPSWQQTLADILGFSLPEDPINKFYGCDDPYDSVTCWDELVLDFGCPQQAITYAYAVEEAGQYAAFYHTFEYTGLGAWSTGTYETIVDDACLNWWHLAGDSDGDGFTDDDDNCPEDYNVEQEDKDSDGLGDACDPCPDESENDADNDSFCAADDNCDNVYNPSQADSDNNGLGDACEAAGDCVADQDGDGVCDPVDNCVITSNASQEDVDNDGVGDACDVCPNDIYNDLDGDGVCYPEDNCPVVYNRDQEDSDNDTDNDCNLDSLVDSIGENCGGDACDLCTDNDHDGYANDPKLFPLNSSSESSCLASSYGDSDGDGIIDSEDNCSQIYNSSQADADVDGLGDACDNCLNVDNVDQQDLDSDGAGDLCDDDSDGDGFTDDDDNCPEDYNILQNDSDADDLGDLCDNCPYNANIDQVDSDSDGAGDACEI